MRATVRSITSISVRKLFGVYDYHLVPNSAASNADKLLILYGDNGSGKTTLLKSIFHLLAPEEGEGHKTEIAATPFQKLEVTFNNGDKVWAQRPDSRLIGSFTMGLKMGRKKEVTVEFIADENNTVPRTPSDSKQNAKTRAFLQALSRFEIALYLLSDDRTVKLAGREKESVPVAGLQTAEADLLLYTEAASGAIRRTFRRNEVGPEGMAQQLLVESLKRAESWIQTQVLMSSSQAESNVNTLYSEILTSLAKLRVGESLKPDASRPSIESRAKRLELRSREYSKYGLLPEFNGKDIVAALSNATRGHVSIISNVVSPYLDSVEKKLEAMAKIHRQIDAVVRVINSFFTRKTISFEMHKGFELKTESGKPLSPQTLSSGERHLLLLFCNTLVAFERVSIFIIDEPEISLNIKWQRRLLSSLLECVGDNPVQYVFATHSLELLAQHRTSVLKLA